MSHDYEVVGNADCIEVIADLTKLIVAPNLDDAITHVNGCDGAGDEIGQYNLLDYFTSIHEVPPHYKRELVIKCLRAVREYQEPRESREQYHHHSACNPKVGSWKSEMLP